MAPVQGRDTSGGMRCRTRSARPEGPDRRWARARWWVPSLVVAVALTSVPSAALAAEDPPDWRPAVRALSGATPAQTSTVLLGAADEAVEGDPDAAVTKAADHLVEDAADRFYGDGLRVTSRIDLVAVGLAEGLASGVLAVKADAASTAPLATSRTDALVDTLSAAVRSARTSLDDARRVTGVTPSSATVPDRTERHRLARLQPGHADVEPVRARPPGASASRPHTSWRWTPPSTGRSRSGPSRTPRRRRRGPWGRWSRSGSSRTRRRRTPTATGCPTRSS